MGYSKKMFSLGLKKRYVDNESILYDIVTVETHNYACSHTQQTV